jgi:hypothetical protein
MISISTGATLAWACSNASPLSDSPLSPTSGSSSIVRPTEAVPAEHSEPQKADVFTQPKKRRKTSPGSTAQPETSWANSTAPRPLPAQPKTPRLSNPSPSTARTLAVAAAAGERERGASSSSATPIHVVEDHAPLKTLRVGTRSGLMGTQEDERRPTSRATVRLFRRVHIYMYIYIYVYVHICAGGCEDG